MTSEWMSAWTFSFLRGIGGWSTGPDHSDRVLHADLLPSHASAMQGVGQAARLPPLVSVKLPGELFTGLMLSLDMDELEDGQVNPTNTDSKVPGKRKAGI